MIYVVGSSFNSLAAANAFVNKELDVTILDVGKKSTFQNKQIIKDLLKKNDIYKVIKFINGITRKNTKNTIIDSILLDVIFNPNKRGGGPNGGTDIIYFPLNTKLYFY